MRSLLYIVAAITVQSIVQCLNHNMNSIMEFKMLYACIPSHSRIIISEFRIGEEEKLLDIPTAHTDASIINFYNFLKSKENTFYQRLLNNTQILGHMSLGRLYDHIISKYPSLNESYGQNKMNIYNDGDDDDDDATYEDFKLRGLIYYGTIRQIMMQIKAMNSCGRWIDEIHKNSV